ncbi:MAG: UbiX family flavin prenyltransferase [Candidatus Bathyarchaeota archaeon]|nr:UbiX family flavin prenyltransferase [Candidatus Bathyarchaeota archaeon]
MKIIVAVTGASGTIYAKSLLEAAKSHGLETHLIVTDAAKKVAKHEIGGVNSLMELADHSYKPDDLEAPIASGSFRVDAMVIVPATMKTIGALAHGYNSNLVTRAADVQLKERRPLIIVPRETPLHAIHLENMAKLSTVGAVILPAMPGFYHDPQSVDDLVRFITGKIMDQLGIPNNIYKRWGEA